MVFWVECSGEALHQVQLELWGCLKALIIDFVRIDGKKRVVLRDNTLIGPIT